MGEQKTVLVTGTSYGIGRTVADLLLARDDRVVALSRTRPPSSIGERWYDVDLSDVAAASLAAGRILDDVGQGGISGVVLNAGHAERAISQWSVDQMQHHFAVNTLGPISLWSALEASGVVAGDCNVMLMGSYLQQGSAAQPAYAMSKAALWTWMRSYTAAQDAASGVAINMMWPGRVDTPGNPKRPLSDDDPNQFYPPSFVAERVLWYLDQEPGGPRGTVLDLGRS